uniref:Putative secreted protein n=1 Tax=Ixodes ricinus TaxID=34613 RepID=A0A6B0UL32_IXORI
MPAELFPLPAAARAAKFCTTMGLIPGLFARFASAARLCKFAQLRSVELLPELGRANALVTPCPVRPWSPREFNPVLELFADAWAAARAASCCCTFRDPRPLLSCGILAKPGNAPA